MHAPAECLLDAIALSLIADGDVTEHEMKLTASMVVDLPPFAGKEPAAIEAIIGEAFERFVSEGPASRMAALAAANLDPEARGEVLLASALVMHADGGIGKEEEASLVELAKTIGATDEERSKVLIFLARTRV